MATRGVSGDSLHESDVSGELEDRFTGNSVGQFPAKALVCIGVADTFNRSGPIHIPGEHDFRLHKCPRPLFTFIPLGTPHQGSDDVPHPENRSKRIP